ncbi:hypothetical protein B7486_54475 [cyanobacterium TDX16]|nr:hypothetical protein B7486_54475 [cyanobacterium TDX16]
MADDLPRFALSIPAFTEPDELVDLGVRAEANGWDGVLLWDHAHGSPDFAVPIADPWVVLGALATHTERIVLGTGVSAPARRRPQTLARQTVTVDRLSGGRLVLGVGLGEPPDEYAAYGEPTDRQVLAAKLDESLEVIAQMWSGEVFEHHGAHLTVERAQFLPTPAQQPRIPVWASCTYPHTAPLRRAARWDGVILVDLAGGGGPIAPYSPDAVREAVAEVRRMRATDAGPFDVVVSHPLLPSAAELDALVDAGATWILVSAWMDELDELVAAPPQPAGR